MSQTSDLHRYCASCEKVVTDFSQMSDDELVSFFRKPTGKSCGRFSYQQLNRDIKRLPERTEKMRWWRMLLLIPLALFSKNARAQYYQLKNPGTDTSFTTNRIPADSSQLVQDDSTATDMNVAADSLQEQQVAIDSCGIETEKTPLPEKPGFYIDIGPFASYGTYVVGDVCVPKDYPQKLMIESLIKGPPFDVEPFFPEPYTTKVASGLPPQNLSSEPEKTPEPQTPGIPANNDLNAILPEQRKRFWKS